MAKKKPAPQSRKNVWVKARTASNTEAFAAVVKLIDEARARAYQSVNKEQSPAKC